MEVSCKTMEQQQDAESLTQASAAPEWATGNNHDEDQQQIITKIKESSKKAGGPMQYLRKELAIGKDDTLLPQFTAWLETTLPTRDDLFIKSRLNCLGLIQRRIKRPHHQLLYACASSLADKMQRL